MSETLDTVAFVRIDWCSCMVHWLLKRSFGRVKLISSKLYLDLPNFDGFNISECVHKTWMKYSNLNFTITSNFSNCLLCEKVKFVMMSQLKEGRLWNLMALPAYMCNLMFNKKINKTKSRFTVIYLQPVSKFLN